MSVSLGGGCCCLLDFQGPIRDSQKFLHPITKHMTDPMADSVNHPPDKDQDHDFHHEQKVSCKL